MQSDDQRILGSRPTTLRINARICKIRQVIARTISIETFERTVTAYGHPRVVQNTGVFRLATLVQTADLNAVKHGNWCELPEGKAARPNDQLLQSAHCCVQLACAILRNELNTTATATAAVSREL